MRSLGLFFVSTDINDFILIVLPSDNDDSSGSLSAGAAEAFDEKEKGDSYYSDDYDGGEIEVRDSLSEVVCGCHLVSCFPEL